MSHRNLRAFMLLGAATLAASASAAPIVIDFENYASTGVHAVVSSGGFDFTPTAGTVAVSANGASCSPNCAANGTTAFVVGGTNLNPPSGAPITMGTGIYASFRLTGLDYAELSNSAASNWSADSIELIGTLLGGGTVTQTLQIDGLNDGPGNANDFQAAALEAFWASSDLVSLQFSGFDEGVGDRAFQLDNIALDVSRVAAVPEPAALALMAAALMAAGAAARRRRQA